MVWFRVDDNFADHPKVRRIPRGQRAAAIGLWTLAGTWASRHLRDGHVPGFMVDELCAKPSSAAALVRVGLWHEQGHDCTECPQVRDEDAFVFHDWTSLQFTREQVHAKRDADAERQRLARERKRAEKALPSQSRHAVTGSDEGVSHATVHVSRTRPVPVPSLTTSVEGERPVPLRAVPATEPPNNDDEICTRHPNGNPTDEPCRGCQAVAERVAKRAARFLEAETAAAEERARSCVRCEGTHFVLDADKKPTRKKCVDHRRTA